MRCTGPRHLARPGAGRTSVGLRRKAGSCDVSTCRGVPWPPPSPRDESSNAHPACGTGPLRVSRPSAATARASRRSPCWRGPAPQVEHVGFAGGDAETRPTAEVPLRGRGIVSAEMLQPGSAQAARPLRSATTRFVPSNGCRRLRSHPAGDVVPRHAVHEVGFRSPECPARGRPVASPTRDDRFGAGQETLVQVERAETDPACVDDRLRSARLSPIDASKSGHTARKHAGSA